jgi:hypothetical protein
MTHEALLVTKQHPVSFENDPVHHADLYVSMVVSHERQSTRIKGVFHVSEDQQASPE